MKTAISIPDKLFQAAEFAARRMGLSRSELYQRALGAFLERHNDGLVTKALDEVYGDDAGGTPLDPLLDHLQTASLPAEEW